MPLKKCNKILNTKSKRRYTQIFENKNWIILSTKALVCIKLNKNN